MINNTLRKIVTAGVFSALIIVLGITGLGFIPLPIAAIAVLHVPVIISAILAGPLVGFFTGLLFGVFSIIQAAMAGVTPVDLAFVQYPWIAIIPRVLIGPAAWFMYTLIIKLGDKLKIKKRFYSNSLAIILGAVLGSMINTIMVLYGLFMLLPEIISWPVVISLVSINGIIEAGLSAAISLAVILPWKGISRYSKSKLSRSLPDTTNSP